MKSSHDLVTEAKLHIREIDLGSADAAVEEADLLIDVREPDEYSAGHIPGALNIPRGILEFRLSSTPELAIRDLKIILYCKTSGRAALSALALGEMGYVNVSSIAGGFDAWVAEAKAVATPSLPAFRISESQFWYCTPLGIH